MKIEESLADLTADLIGCKANSAFLERLFSLKAGVWADVTDLCRDIVHLEDHIAQLQRSSKGRLRATWLNYPISTHGKGYCLIIFFMEELHWSNVALYNKQWFSQKVTHRVRTTNQYEPQRELDELDYLGAILRKCHRPTAISFCSSSSSSCP
jgi:hypothetical protein